METPKKPVKSILQEKLCIPASPHLKKLGFGSGNKTIKRVLVYEFVRSPNKKNSVKSPWAVKMLNSRVKNHHSKVYEDRLRSEAEILRQINCPYIVGFRSYGKNLEGREFLAMEECTTSLDNLIEKRFDDSNLAFPPIKILKAANDISKALDYLHNTMYLLHADIKSHNVLIKGDFDICKLCDFGVSLPLKVNGHLNEVKSGKIEEYDGTISWSSPEVLKYPPIITSKADIFAFGLVIWEMIALDVPHSNSAENFDDNFENCDILNLDDSNLEDESYQGPYGTRPPIPDHTIEKVEDYESILEIFHICTEQDFNKRPDAKTLVALIDEISTK